MKTAILSTVFSALCTLSLVSAAALDVYAPPVTSPTLGTVWKIGETVTVTWDTSNPPKQITNRIGEVHLRNNGATDPTALASGFSILDGNVTLTVPDVEPSVTYQVVLYGDSGNFSPAFTIVKA